MAPSSKQSGMLSKAKAFLAGMGISVIGAISITWGAIKWGESVFIQPYLQRSIAEQFDTLHEPYSKEIQAIGKDIRLVREIMELTTPDSVKRRAVRKIRESEIWATR